MDSAEVKRLKEDIERYEKEIEDIMENGDYAKEYDNIQKLRDIIHHEKVQLEYIQRQERSGSREKEYSYESGWETHLTENPAIAARYDAQHRMFRMNKVKKIISTITGQKRKFKKLWRKAGLTTDKYEQEDLAEKMNKLFR